jgi:signal transduction histidine kinase/CheY-like chemotaxis protein/PAS domain-containing protein
MHSSGSHNGPHLEGTVRLVIVNSPDAAAPLIGALDVAGIGAWMWVEAERALYFSPRVLDLLGLSPEPQASLLTRFFQCVHVDDQEPVRALLLGAREAGPFCIRYRFTPPHGPLRWIEDRGRVERDAAGALIRQGGAMREVTREVGRELERREADARLEALVNAMPFAVWGRSGPNLILAHQNAESINTWGDMRGHALTDAPPEVRDLWAEQLAEVMSGQVVRVRRDHVLGGELRTIHEIIAPVIVENQVTGAVGVGIDVSEEARASKFQTLLTELAADFAGRAADTLDDGLVRGLQKVAQYLGAPLAVLGEVTGGRDAHHLHLTHWWVDPATGHERPRATEIDTRRIRSLFDQVASNTPVLVRSRADLPADSAERAWLEEHRVQSFAMVPTRQLDGTQTLLGFASAHDAAVDWPPDTITCLRLAATLFGGVLARARAEDERRTTERRMQDAQRLESLGVLAGGIAHDFNNLLTAILGNASLLRAELPEVDGAADAVEQIEAASRRAAELCRQMLAYAGRGRFALQLLELNALLRDMRAPLELTVANRARLEMQLAPSLPAVVADEPQIRQLIMNLVMNAIEATAVPGGTITLRTDSVTRSSEELAQTVFSPQLPGGLYVSLRVSDTGHGMSPDTAARIFDPFFSTRFTGRGLGLAAVVGIVRAHKGALRVESAVDAGSTFELLLPAQAGVPLAPPEALSAATNASLSKWRTTGTALVIDDERGVRDLVRAVLERSGMTVIEADSGEQGLALFAQIAATVRVVLVDLTMPGLDGRETLRAIREQRPDVPAVLMSGYSPADLLNSKSFLFLQKPFTPGALRTVIKRVLEE